MNFSNAKRQFDENKRLFGDPQAEPEKFNLYQGLANLATGLEKLERRLVDLEDRIRRLESGARRSL